MTILFATVKITMRYVNISTTTQFVGIMTNFMREIKESGVFFVEKYLKINNNSKEKAKTS